MKKIAILGAGNLSEDGLGRYLQDHLTTFLPETSKNQIRVKVSFERQ